MSLTLVVEDGTAKSTANTFISRTDAATALGYRPHGDAWAGVDSTTQDKILVWACKLLTEEIHARGWRWRGLVVSDAQALPFPRDGVYSPEGVIVDNDSVPQVIIDAQLEIALLMVSADLQRRGDKRVEQSVGLKDASVSYVLTTNPVIPDRVLAPLLLTYVDTGRRLMRA